MEIFNRIDISQIKVNKAEKKVKSKKISFSGEEHVSSSSAIESIAKAKINLDNTYTKPIPYEKKLEFLKQREIPDTEHNFFLSQNDETFKTMLEYYDVGLTLENLKSIYDNNFWNNESEKKLRSCLNTISPLISRKIYFYFTILQKKKLNC